MAMLPYRIPEKKGFPVRFHALGHLVKSVSFILKVLVLLLDQEELEEVETNMIYYATSPNLS
jgi:hypothetical protein